MKNLFEMIPDNFFVPLSTQNKSTYWDCIVKLFFVTNEQLSFGVRREALVSELTYYFDRQLSGELDDADFLAADSRGRANLMLRRLEYYGWIGIETDKSYVQRVDFKEYAVRVIKTLLEISDGRKIEYQGYIYTIYSLVKDETKSPGVVLLQIVENADLLITGLKNLNSNIKYYIDTLTAQATVAEIMDVLFNDYITNIVDKAYHRLLTSDNVSKFRPEIIRRLEANSKDGAYIEAAASELAGVKEIGEDEARELVFTYLHEVIEAFRGMDAILDEINAKNAQYQRAAIARAKFLLTGSEDVRGSIKEILLALGRQIGEQNLDFAGIYRIEYLDHLFSLFSCRILDEQSLSTPIEGREAFVPHALGNEAVDETLRDEKVERMMEKMHRMMSAKKIDAYVEDCLGSASSMRASRLPLTTREDFIKLIYTRLYGGRRNMTYRVEAGENVTINGFGFRDFTIIKKQ